MNKFARKCSISGLGMNEGFCFFDGEMYIKDKSDAIKYIKNLGYKSLDEAYKDEAYYWTEWEVEDEDDYYNEQGDMFSFDK